MTTPSMTNEAAPSWFPWTGRPPLAIERSYSPKPNRIPLTVNIYALYETPSVSDKGILVNSAETSVLRDTPSAEFARQQRLNHYLSSVRVSGDITADTAEIAWKAWKQLNNSMNRSLLVPDAAPGPDGQLLYAWNKGEHHLELEIFPNGPAEFFYLNRLSNETWEEDYSVDDPISHDAKGRLAVFI